MAGGPYVVDAGSNPYDSLPDSTMSFDMNQDGGKGTNKFLILIERDSPGIMLGIYAVTADIIHPRRNFCRSTVCSTTNWTEELTRSTLGESS